MGKGDKKTRRGKIWRGTFGKRRPKAKNQPGKKPAATGS
jgi:30S ribosomal protein S31